MKIVATALPRIAIIAMTMAVVSSCRPEDAQNSGDARIPVVAPTLSFVNYREAYNFTVFLNEEPIVSGSGLTPRDWRGFPIRSGTNVLRFEALALNDTASTSVYAQINLSGPVQKEIAVIRDSCQATNKLVKEYHFELATDANVSNTQYELIPSDVQAISNQLTKLSLSMISTANSRDPKQISTLLNIGVPEVKSRNPTWYFDPDQKVEIASITNAADLDFTFGHRFVMVRPGSAYLKSHPQSGMYVVKNSSTGFELKTDSLIFCRLKGKWRWLHSDGSTTELQN